MSSREGGRGDYQKLNSKSCESEPEIVEFSAPIYFATEGEIVAIDVLRSGLLHQEVTVSYHTLDSSAKEGRQYIAASGELTFGPEEHIKRIEIETVEHEEWTSTQEFKVFLTDPENCTLCKENTGCRVKIIDNNTFPSSKYQKEIAGGADSIDKLNGLLLFAEYYKLNLFHVDGILWRTLLTLLLDQMQNLYLLFKIWATVYFTDTLFADTQKTEEQMYASGELFFPTRYQTAQVIGIMYVLPMFLVHAWDFAKVGLDIVGHSRVFLQQSLFRRYLNFTEQSRQKVHASDMQMAVNTDAREMADGYVAVLEMMQIIGKLVVLITYILTEDPSAVWCVMGMPTLMFIFGIWRQPVLSDASDLVDKKAEEVIALTSEICMNYRLIADYKQRPKMNDMFEAEANGLRQAEIPEAQIKLNNNYFPKWLGPILVSYYIITCGPKVVDKNEPLSLGLFLATIRLFFEISGDFSELYKVFLRVSRRLDPLKGLTAYFNLETDLLAWKEVSQRNRDRTFQAHDELIDEKADQSPDIKRHVWADDIPIKLEHVTFEYHSRTFNDVKVFDDVSISVPQGKLIAVVGPHGSGRHSLLKILGQAIFPTEGELFMPSHLRILHVSQEPMLLSLSLQENLCFGLDDPDEVDPQVLDKIMTVLKIKKTKHRMEAAQDERTMKKIQERKESRQYSHETSSQVSWPSRSDDERSPIGSPREIRTRELILRPNDEVNGNYHEMDEESDDDDDDDEDDKMSTSWLSELHYTERVQIHLARAFLVNPEILVLQRPLHHFDHVRSGELLKVIMTHVSNCGLGMSEETRGERRPRTVFFSPETKDQAAKADVIWQITDKGKVRETTTAHLANNFEFATTDLQNDHHV